MNSLLSFFLTHQSIYFGFLQLVWYIFSSISRLQNQIFKPQESLEFTLFPHSQSKKATTWSFNVLRFWSFCCVLVSVSTVTDTHLSFFIVSCMELNQLFILPQGHIRKLQILSIIHYCLTQRSKMIVVESCYRLCSHTCEKRVPLDRSPWCLLPFSL